MTDEVQLPLKVFVDQVFRDTDPRFPRRRVVVTTIHHDDQDPDDFYDDVDLALVGVDGSVWPKGRFRVPVRHLKWPGGGYAPDDTGLPAPTSRNAEKAETPTEDVDA